MSITSATPAEAKQTAEPLPVSVIVPTLNRGDYLLGTLRDLVRQNPPPREIIVVDQTPHYALAIETALRELVDQHGIIYERINRRGASVARNHGIALAQGEILLFVDDDIEAPETLCAVHYSHYGGSSAYDGVAGPMLSPTQAPTMELPKEYFWPHVGWMFAPLDYGLALDNFILPTCNMSIRRSIALAIGGFDENLTRLEDSDFSWRAHAAGARVTYAPAAWVIHLLAPTGAARWVFKPINDYVISRRDAWYEWFYLLLASGGLLKGWRFFGYWFRRHITRKVLLQRPHYLLLALTEVLIGYLAARQRLASGRATRSDFRALSTHGAPSEERCSPT